MTKTEIARFAEQVHILESMIPPSGGKLTIHHLRGTEGTLTADRTGFMRLGLAVLRYAIDAQPRPPRMIADGVLVEDLFAPPSEVRKVLVQMHDAPWKHAAPRSLLGGIGRLLRAMWSGEQT
jgi:hypothetical protein